MLNELGVHTVEDLFTQRHLLARVFSPTMFDFLMRVSDEANNPSATFEPHGPVRLSCSIDRGDAMGLRALRVGSERPLGLPVGIAVPTTEVGALWQR
jgi:hypothetical protein